MAMNSAFDDQRPIFAVLDQRAAWGAFLAGRIARDAQGSQRANRVAIRHIDDLEALDSCLIDNQTPVGILLADDFAELPQLASFVNRLARRPRTLVIVAAHAGDREVGWLLREAGAHMLVGNIEEVMALVAPLRRFFERFAMC
jgi:hypothetical protein